MAQVYGTIERPRRLRLRSCGLTFPNPECSLPETLGGPKTGLETDRRSLVRDLQEDLKSARDAWAFICHGRCRCYRSPDSEDNKRRTLLAVRDVGGLNATLQTDST